jgi:hypothetical protein
VYTSRESEKTSPIFSVPYFQNFLSPNGHFSETFPVYPGVTERSPHTFKSILYNLQVSPSKLSMAIARGGGATRGGGGDQEPPAPPRIFSKVAARYAPLVLPVPLHDLPENYMKNLLKFTGEGDLTPTEHINFVGKCLTGSVCLSLMASTTVKMAGSECELMDKQEQRRLRRN